MKIDLKGHNFSLTEAAIAEVEKRAKEVGATSGFLSEEIRVGWSTRYSVVLCDSIGYVGASVDIYPTVGEIELSYFKLYHCDCGTGEIRAKLGTTKERIRGFYLPYHKKHEDLTEVWNCFCGCGFASYEGEKKVYIPGGDYCLYCNYEHVPARGKGEFDCRFCGGN